MKVSELIEQLEEAREDIGDAQVYVNVGGLGDEEELCVYWFPNQAPSPHVEIGLTDHDY